mmetsp:Transcript_6155/g.12523  ORF Transcript_6155/g.12523 Transcript_6155/m.12523 type:complete len:104 (+) Transcript_6155:632-943(+)
MALHCITLYYISLHCIVSYRIAVLAHGKAADELLMIPSVGILRASEAARSKCAAIAQDRGVCGLKDALCDRHLQSTDAKRPRNPQTISRSRKKKKNDREICTQ